MGCMSEGALAPEFLTISHFTFDQTRIKGQRRQVINRQPRTSTSTAHQHQPENMQHPAVIPCEPNHSEQWGAGTST